MYHQNLSGSSMSILWLQRVFKRADVSENYLKHFSQLWLSRCVVEQTPQGSPKALVEQKQSESIKNWQSHKFFTKKSCFGALKALEALGDLKTHSNHPKLSFWWLKTENSSIYITKFKWFQKLIFSTFWFTTRRVCSQEEVRPLYTLLRWIIEKLAS